jgi:hypothetical protein
LWIADFGLQISDCESRITNCESHRATRGTNEPEIFRVHLFYADRNRVQRDGDTCADAWRDSARVSKHARAQTITGARDAARAQTACAKRNSGVTWFNPG